MALVFSRLDYGSATLAGLPSQLMDRLYDAIVIRPSSSSSSSSSSRGREFEGTELVERG